MDTDSAHRFDSPLLRYRRILRLVWPLALGMINNAVMQFVDRAYLAHHSMAALEAVLPACALAGVVIGFFQAVVAYSGVFVSQYHGAGERDRTRIACVSGLAIAVLSGLLMLPMVPVGDWILSLTASRGPLAELESRYYGIVCAGSVFLFLQMALASYCTGRGHTRIVFWVNLGGNLVNIALDPLLIFVLDMGIGGAAIATVLSQLLQFAALVAVLFRSGDGIRCGSAGLAEALRLVPRILRFGIPAGGYEILNMASFTIFIFVTGTMDEISFAASNACFTISYLLFAPMTGFALGAQTLVGQCLGRRDPDGASIALRRTLVLGLGFSALALLAVLVFHGPVLALFAPGDSAAAADFASLGFRLLLIMSAWMLFDALDTIISGALKGAGDTRFVFLWMLFGAFVLWLPLVFLFRRIFDGMAALWCTMVIYVLVLSVGTAVRWFRGSWRRHRMI